jgi:nicotinamide-nucleotide amidase
MLAERLTAVPGSSDYFRGGFITYTNDGKIEWLGVRAETIEKHGAVSRETAEEMAECARQKAAASVGASTTGIAGPGGGSKQTPVGTVFIAVADAAGVEVQELHLPGKRERVRMWATTRALDLLRRRLSGA